MSCANGCRALAHSRSTRPGVSSELSVVRSISVMARSSQAACHSFFTVRRVPMVAARRSSAERFMRTRPTQSRSSGKPGLRAGGADGLAAGRGGFTGAAGVSTTLRLIAPPMAPFAPARDCMRIACLKILAAVYRDCAVTFNRAYFGRYSGPNECGSSSAKVWCSGAPSTPWLMTTTSWSANSRRRWRQPPHGVTGAAPGPVT